MAGKSTNKKADDYAMGMIQNPGIRSTSDMARELSSKFDETINTAYNRIRRAFKQMGRIDSGARPYRKHQVIQTLVEMIRVSWSMYLETQVAQHGQLAGAAIRELAKIDGMYEPEKVEVTGRKIESMTPHEMREYVEKAFSDPSVKGLLQDVMDGPAPEEEETED